MKTKNVVCTSLGVAAVLLFIVFVPLPISRVLQTGLVDLNQDQRYSQVVPVKDSGWLGFPQVKDGQFVKEGDTLCVMSNPILHDELQKLKDDQSQYRDTLEGLADERKHAERIPDPKQKAARLNDLDVQKVTAENKIKELQLQIDKKKEKLDGLQLRAPRDGKVFGVPRTEEVGKYWEPTQHNTFCRVGQPDRLIVIVPVTNSQYKLIEEDMQKAAKKGSSLEATVRVQGMVEKTVKGRVLPLPQEVAREGDIPPQLTNKYGGPIAVKQGTKSGSFIPQNQQYLVSVEIIDPDIPVTPGVLAQVKIHCLWRPTSWWIWNKITDTFDIPFWVKI